MLAKQKIVWRNRTNVGFNTRFMGFYESPKEILARSSYCYVAFTGSINRVVTGFGGSTVYLYFVLILLAHS